jgi:NADPH-dependent curcumin reductase CurA
MSAAKSYAKPVEVGVGDIAVGYGAGRTMRLRTVLVYANSTPRRHRSRLRWASSARMSAAKSYAKPVEVGATMVGGTVGEVVASRNPNFAVGDIAVGYGGWQDYAVANGSGLRKLNPAAAPVSTALGVLGMPGMTAYAGLLEIGRPQTGETVAVAAASGAVCSVVGQIAKIKGCRAVGIAGGPDKCRFVVEELAVAVRRQNRALADQSEA